MRKFFSILMVALLAAAFVSCGKDEDTSDNGGGNSQYAQWLVGTWKVDYSSFNGREDTPENMLMEFYSNGTGLLNDNGETEHNDFSWAISGNTINITTHNGSHAGMQLSFTITSMTATEATFTGEVMPGSDMQGDVVIRIVKVNNGGGNEDPLNIADNTLVYDGITYLLEAQFAYPNNSMGWLMIQSVEKDDNEEPIIRMPHEEVHLYSYLVGQTIDLTQIFREWPGYEFALEGAINWQFGSYEVNEETYIGGTIEGTDYDNVSPFKNGSTMKITVENDTFTLVINAESKNGHKLNLRVVTSANGWHPGAE